MWNVKQSMCAHMSVSVHFSMQSIQMVYAYHLHEYTHRTDRRTVLRMVGHVINVWGCKPLLNNVCEDLAKNKETYCKTDPLPFIMCFVLLTARKCTVFLTFPCIYSTAGSGRHSINKLNWTGPFTRRRLLVWRTVVWLILKLEKKCSGNMESTMTWKSRIMMTLNNTTQVKQLSNDNMN